MYCTTTIREGNKLLTEQQIQSFFAIGICEENNIIFRPIFGHFREIVLVGHGTWNLDQTHDSVAIPFLGWAFLGSPDAQGPHNKENTK